MGEEKSSFAALQRHSNLLRGIFFDIAALHSGDRLVLMKSLSVPNIIDNSICTQRCDEK